MRYSDLEMNLLFDNFYRPNYADELILASPWLVALHQIKEQGGKKLTDGISTAHTPRFYMDGLISFARKCHRK